MKIKLFFIFIIIFTSCKLNNDFEYDIIISGTATNLIDLNSEYDDYNSDLPNPGQTSNINYSSNRNSQGGNFDIITGSLYFSYHEKENILNVTSIFNISIINQLLPIINSENNEFGPYTNVYDDSIRLLYATDINDTFNIKFATYHMVSYVEQGVSGPFDLGLINDFGDNLYPSINNNKNELFFCSNRNDSVFNIYSAKYNTEITDQSLINGNINYIEKNEVVSTLFDDKCPFILNEYLIFTSTRDDGFGGYDLWYSVLVNNSWTNPINFGDKINSEFDEYRPIVFNIMGFNLMIFSSNRPGGKGGFDLYIVNVDDFIENNVQQKNKTH